MARSARSDTICSHMYSEKHLRKASGHNGIRRLLVPQRLHTTGECWKLRLTSMTRYILRACIFVGLHSNTQRPFLSKFLSLHYSLWFPFIQRCATCTHDTTSSKKQQFELQINLGSLYVEKAQFMRFYYIFSLYTICKLTISMVLVLLSEGCMESSCI